MEGVREDQGMRLNWLEKIEMESERDCEKIDVIGNGRLKEQDG